MRKFFLAKDLRVEIDYGLLVRYNERVAEQLQRINYAIHPSVRHPDIDSQIEKYIYAPFLFLKEHDLIGQFTNNGRPVENVYFSWLRGYAICGFLRPSICALLGIDDHQIFNSGGDSLTSPADFNRNAAADLTAILKNGARWKIEVQAGFTAEHDLKRHKVTEAVRNYRESGVPSALIHLDVFAGRLALIALHRINESQINWMKKGQFEGQPVIPLPSHVFIWQINESPPSLASSESWPVI